jgi:hypothetical protein
MRKKDDNSGTNPARTYATKKMKSPGLMWASDAAPCFSLGTRPGACHPISRRRLAREIIDLNREGGSSAAMVVNDGRGLKKPRGAGSKGDGRGWQEEYGSVCWVPSPIYPPLQAVAYWVRRFVPAPCVGHAQVLTRGPGSTHQLPLVSEVMVQRHRNGTPHTSHMRDILLVQGSWS